MKPQSQKRSALTARRQEVVDIVRRRDRYCAFDTLDRRMGKCSGPFDVHEVLPRSASTKSWLDPSVAVLVCRRHHDLFTAEPHAAMLVGMKAPRRPAELEVATAHSQIERLRRFVRTGELEPSEWLSLEEERDARARIRQMQGR